MPIACPISATIRSGTSSLAYVMAAQIAAFGGLIYPLLRGFVAPNLFGFEVSTKAVVMSLVGGVGTLLGPLWAA